jgi:hypothetical protein
MASGLHAADVAADSNAGFGKITTYTTTYQSFNPTDGLFDLTSHIAYQLPDPKKFGPGPYPVFIYVPGSFETYNDPLALTFYSQMTLRGFIGASVEYMNTESVFYCTPLLQRSQGIFDAKRTTSAISTLCSMPQANCSKGVVIAGASQGGMIGFTAANYAPQVKAAYILSASDYAQGAGGVSFASCVDKQYTALPADRLTIVNGASDDTFGGQQPMENASGFTCPDGTVQCWSPDGSGAGWYNVQDSQVEDGLADHCYFMVNNYSSKGCAGVGDPGWLPPATNNWSLKSNLDWLATLGTHRNFSSNGQ